MEEELKRIKNKRKNNKETKKSILIKKNKSTNLIAKILIVIIITLSILIMSKTSKELNLKIKRIIFENNFNFNKYMNEYSKYFSEFLPFEKFLNTETVFNEELKFNEKNIYHDGVELKVGQKYLVPSIDSGLVVYIGEKENYGKVVIIQQVNGIDLWYGNLDTVAVDLYDYIEKGTLIGETLNDSLFVVLEKEGTYLNYDEYY